MKHTPTPIWVYENSKGCRFCGHKLHASEKNPCNPDNMPHKDLYTARWCNEYVLKSSHDELLEAAKLSLDAMKQAKQDLESFNYLNNDKNILPSSTSNLEEAIEWIEKAIQKADGK